MPKLWLVMLLVFVSSCAIDPQYSLKKPINIPTAWQTKDSHYKNQKAKLACLPWWKQFHDKTLNHLVFLALKNNQDIQIAVGNVEAAQGELKRVELNWIPTIGSMIGYSSFPYLGYPGVLAIAGPTYTVNVFGQIKDVQRARAELKVSKAMRDSVKIAIIANMVRSYMSYLAAVEQLQLLKKVEQDLQSIVNIAQSTYSGGLTSDIELSQAKSSLKLIQAKETIVKNNIVLSEHAIRFLLNQNPCPFQTKRRFAAISGDGVVIGSLPINVIENRPDMRASIAEVKAANAGIGLALSQFLPTLQIDAARGDIATVPNGSTLGKPIYFTEALLHQPVITLSSFGALDKARGFNHASYYRYVKTLREALREVNNDLSAHEQFTARLHETQDAKKEVQQVYQLNRNLYDQGIISYRNLLNEKIKYDQIAVLLNQRKLDQLTTIITLYQDLALGYDVY